MGLCAKEQGSRYLFKINELNHSKRPKNYVLLLNW